MVSGMKSRRKRRRALYLIRLFIIFIINPKEDYNSMQNSFPQQFWFVYILKCNNRMSYTGCTNNLEDRLKSHNMGQVASTKDNLPVELITYTAFNDKIKAYKFEKYLKQGSGRAFSKRHF